MDPNDLSLTFLGLTLLYPPLPRFKGNELPDFYAEVCKRHQFDSFSLSGDDGALLQTEGERKLRIERDEFEYSEQVRNVRSAFPMVKQRTVDLISDATQHFGLRLFLPEDCTARALWATPKDLGNIEDELRQRAFSIRDDQFAQLGGLSGVGIHLTGHKGDESDFGWGVEIAPYLPEEGYLFLQVNAHRHRAIASPEEAGEFMQETYEFLTNTVVHFVNAFL